MATQEAEQEVQEGVNMGQLQLPTLSFDVSQTPGIFESYLAGRKKREEVSAIEKEQALDKLKQEAMQNPQALQALSTVSPKAALQIQEYQSNQAINAGRIALAFKNTNRADKPKIYQQALKQLESQGIDIGYLPAEYNPDDERNVTKIDSAVDFAINSARDIEKQLGSQRKIIETAQGTFTVDPMTGQAIPVQMGEQRLTPYIKPPTTQISIDTKAEGKEAEELAKLRAKRFDTLLQAGDSARRGYETLDTLQRAVQNPEAAQGAFAGIRSESKKIADLFGFDVEGLEDDAIIAAVGNKLALQLRNPKGEDGGLTGATSDRDIKFLVAGVPNRNKTRSQNLALIQIAKKDKERTSQLASFADQYLQETGSLKGLERAKKEWLENHPLYTEGEEKERIKQMLKGEGIKSGESNGIKWRLK